MERGIASGSRGAALVLLAACAGPGCASLPGPAEPTTLLMVDDHDVLYRSGTRRVVHPLQRHPANPLLRTDRPWEVAVAWTSVHRDPGTGRIQLWYQAYAEGKARERTHTCVVCYAESKDGVHFEKPDLDLHRFNDIAKTNTAA